MKEDRIENLFKEIYKKPEGLDENIMSAIYQVAEIRKLEKTEEQQNVEVTEKDNSWIWITVSLVAFILLGIVFMVLAIDLPDKSLIIAIMSALLIPFGLDKLISRKSHSKVEDY